MNILGGNQETYYKIISYNKLVIDLIVSIYRFSSIYIFIVETVVDLFNI